MKVVINVDEQYPFYTTNPPSEFEKKYKPTLYDITRNEYSDYKRVMAEFDAWQERLNQLTQYFDNAKP